MEDDLLFESKRYNIKNFLVSLLGISVVVFFFYQMHPPLTLEQKTSDAVLSWVLASFFLLFGYGSILILVYSLRKISLTSTQLSIRYPLSIPLLSSKTITLNAISGVLFYERSGFLSSDIVVQYEQDGKSREMQVAFMETILFQNSLEQVASAFNIEVQTIITEKHESVEEESSVPEQENGIIKNYLNLAGGVFFLIIWLIFFISKDTKPTKYSDLTPITARVSVPPSWVEVSDNEYIKFMLEGYHKTFLIAGEDMLSATCTDTFIEDASMGVQITIFINNEKLEELDQEFKVNNNMAITQIQIDGYNYTSLEMYDELRTADRIFGHFILVGSLLCFIYAFFSKPKIGIWTSVIIFLIAFLCLNLINEGEIDSKYDPCAKFSTES
ncbi:MAG: hypothetical protein AAF740_11220 [Bacteroidota bacterium]